MTTRPYPFQETGAKRLWNKFDLRAILADEMGLGKTFTSLLAAWLYLPEDSVIVVVCPATIKINWQREAMKHLGLRVEVLYGMRPPKRIPQALTTGRIFVLNYDILGPVHTHDPTWNKFLRELDPTLVIGDEAHYLSNPDAKRTKYFRQLVQGVPHVLLLSGTPLTNRPFELWSLLNIVKPKLFPNRYRFGYRFCRPEITNWGVKFKGAARLPELHRKLKRTVMVRRTKAEVLKDLPAKTRTVIPVELPPKVMAEYREAEQDIVKWLRKKGRHTKASFTAERLVRYGHLLRLAAELKLPHVRDWIDDYLKESDGKLLVYGVHKLVVRSLEEHYKHQAVRVDGSITKGKRQKAIDQFLGNPNTRLFFGNIQAAGVGWSAQGVSDGIFAELTWRPGDHAQAEDRIHGIGRGKKGSVSHWRYLVAAGTIEEDLCRLLQSKQGVLDQTLDGKASKDGLDILDRLEEVLIARGRKLTTKRGKK